MSDAAHGVKMNLTLPVETALPWQPAHFQASDGTRLWYEMAGEPGPGGLDLVLCDGIGCAGFVWKYLAPALAPFGRLIHLHMRGHGRSEHPPAPQDLSIERLALDWQELLAHLGSQRTVLLGHSLGVQVALELRRIDSARTQALVLMCGSYENPLATFQNISFFDKVMPLLEGLTVLGSTPLKHVWRYLIQLPAAYHVATQMELHPDLMRRADVEAYLKDLSHMDPVIFTRMLKQATRHSAKEQLGQIHQPTLVISGGKDRFTPPKLSQKMAELLPAGQLFCLEEGAHAAPVELPIETNLAVVRFLQEAGLSMRAQP